MTVPSLDAIRARADAAEAEGNYGYEEEARSDVRALLAEIERLQEALGFYASEDTWRYCPTDRGAEHAANDDRRERARAALPNRA